MKGTVPGSYALDRPMYCQSPNYWGCTSNTTFGVPANSGYVDPDGYSYIDYNVGQNNFRTCDSRDFTSATC